MTNRQETDLLGTQSISNDHYYGLQTQRALGNFALGEDRVSMSLIQAIILVKKACCQANLACGLMDETLGEWILKACDAVLKPQYKDQFVTHPLQGGAGTSTNMNVNEVIANVALELAGHPKGAYHIIHPLDHVNMSQSTNDVYPTALRIAAIYKIRRLAETLSELQEAFQEKESSFSHILKLGRTQLMDALPITLGQSFGAFGRAVSRDRWRIYKMEERLREVNLGGTAIGTGLNATNPYIFRVTDALQQLTGLGLARSEFPIDTTQNMDVFVEISGLLKAAATTLLKISNDLRLMASGPRGGFGEIHLPDLQAGSTIMPGKVNPVMAEMMGTVAMKVMANDLAITLAASAGQLELNAFTPLIADSLLNSLDLLNQGVQLFTTRCVEGIVANPIACLAHLENSTALVTALVHHVGYDIAAELAKEMLATGKTLSELVVARDIMSEEALSQLLKPFEITSPGVPGVK